MNKLFYRKTDRGLAEINGRSLGLQYQGKRRADELIRGITDAS